MASHDVTRVTADAPAQTPGEANAQAEGEAMMPKPLISGGVVEDPEACRALPPCPFTERFFSGTG